MNPVRTLGPAIAANNYKGLWLYMIGPPLGALGGATAYALIRLSDDDPGPSRSVRSFRRSATPTLNNHPHRTLNPITITNPTYIITMQPLFYSLKLSSYIFPSPSTLISLL